MPTTIGYSFDSGEMLTVQFKYAGNHFAGHALEMLIQ